LSATTENGHASTRSASFACPGPAELDLRLNTARIDVRVADVPHVRVEVSLDQDEGRRDERAIRALQDVQITFSEDGRRLVLRTPRELRRTRLAVLVEAPARSRLATHLHSGSVAASGVLGGLDATTGAGDVSAGDVEGNVEVKTGSGDVRLGRVAGRFRSRSGSGDVDVTTVTGDEASLVTGSGDIRLGTVSSDVVARAGSGSLTVAQAAQGRLNLATGSGDIRVAIQQGTAAELDLTSGTGKARSELDVSDERPAGPASVTVRARTGSGDAVVTRAAD
jgi:DUF4097 and DUF4098 domain-containing protein YvlB